MADKDIDIQNKVQLFNDKKIRSEWDSEEEQWYFSVIDVIAVLTDSVNPRDYWFKMKKRVHSEDGIELSTICRQLKMRSSDGKMRETDVANTEALLRIIQSVPSKKAEPFKMWLAKVGSEALDEAVDPELSIDKAIQNYRNLGYSENWINQRIKSIEVRKALTDEWDKAGVKKGREYAALTDLMYRTWADMSAKEYKEYKVAKVTSGGRLVDSEEKDGSIYYTITPVDDVAISITIEKLEQYDVEFIYDKEPMLMGATGRDSILEVLKGYMGQFKIPWVDVADSDIHLFENR